MIRQIKAECYKLIKSEFYHRLFVIYIFVSIAVLSMERGTKMEFYLTGYEWFCVRQLMGSLGWMVFSFFVAEYMAAEFENHAFESALMCGYTRKEIFRAKFIVCMLAFLVLALAKELLINNYLQNIPSCAILSSNISNCIGGKNGYTC